VGVDLLRELLLALDHPQVRRRNSRETKPVSRPRELYRIDDDVSDTGVDMELHESAATKNRFHRVPCTSITIVVELHHGFSDTEEEEIAGVHGPGILQVFED
jgi:hypothetical protein